MYVNRFRKRYGLLLLNIKRNFQNQNKRGKYENANLLFACYLPTDNQVSTNSSIIFIIYKYMLFASERAMGTKK